MNNEGKEIVNGIEVNTKKAQKILTKYPRDAIVCL